ncbi:MAG TPA: succinate dehydrogenase, hydrophobic membrane anchor protein [Steroidobacteraceae bacterium]|nr:succinate dehydrogenase, hydrophobic membrane anchor protein [Steroidobacteraceae bacterium]
MSLRSPLARVLYHGAAHDGVGHWWVQRVTAVALAPLALWLTVSLLALPDGYGAVCAWIGAGVHPVLLALTVLLAVWHSWLGLQVVIEDYVHGFLVKTASLLLSTFVHGLLAAGALYAVLRIALKAAA